MKILLASSSQRRKMLLSKITDKFQTITPREPNHLAENLDANGESLRMAQFKAQWAALKNPKMLVIGSDTLVEVSGKKLSKPKNAREARRYLRLISGSRFHALSATCLCIFDGKRKIKMKVWNKKCQIECRKLDAKEINSYIKSKKWIGKAGGFNILERPASSWMRTKKEDLDAIAGLDIAGIKNEIKKF